MLLDRCIVIKEHFKNSLPREDCKDKLVVSTCVRVRKAVLRCGLCQTQCRSPVNGLTWGWNKESIHCREKCPILSILEGFLHLKCIPFLRHLWTKSQAKCKHLVARRQHAMVRCRSLVRRLVRRFAVQIHLLHGCHASKLSADPDWWAVMGRA